MGASMTRRRHGGSIPPVACVAFLLAGVLSGSAMASERDVDSALKAMGAEIADVRKSCNEPVAVEAHEVALSDRVKGVHVILAASPCLGQWGRYDYLSVADAEGHWHSILGGPGPVRFVRRPRSRVARIDVSALMGCELRFIWNGTIYVRHGSPECTGGSKGAGWPILERIVRASEKRT